MKSVKNKKINALFAVCMVAILIISGVVAFMTASDSKANNFTAGNVKIKLWEKFDVNANRTIDADEIFESENGVSLQRLKKITPNVTILKEPYIENTGKNGAYVFVLYGIPKGTVTLEGEENESVVPLFTVNNLDTENWELFDPNYATKVGENGLNYDFVMYSYKTVLASGETSSSLFDSIHYVNYSHYNAGTINLTVPIYAYAIQADGFENAEKAWNSFNSGTFEIPGFDENGVLIEPTTVAPTTKPETTVPEETTVTTTIAQHTVNIYTHDEKVLIGTFQVTSGSPLSDCSELMSALETAKGAHKSYKLYSDEEKTSEFSLSTAITTGENLYFEAIDE